MGPYSRSRSVENVHELIRWAKHGKTDTVRRIGLKWKREARKNSLRRFSFIPSNILQGDPKGSERFYEAVLRSLGDFK